MYTQWAETKHKNLWLHYIIKWCALHFFLLLYFWVASCPFISIWLGLHPGECSTHYTEAHYTHCVVDEPRSSSFIIFFILAADSSGLLLSCLRFISSPFFFRQTEDTSCVTVWCMSFGITRSNQSLQSHT